MSKKKDIPTLTNIVHEGDDEMLNHFDAHQLGENNEETSDVPHLTENATSFENIDIESDDFENIEINSNELDDIPSITLDKNAPDIDFSDDNDSATDFPLDTFIDIETPEIEQDLDSTPEKNIPDEDSHTSRPQKEAIQKKIDEAIADAMPWIELNLKKHLYKKFDI